MFKLNDKVAVQMGDWKFESTVVDIVDNPKSNGVWVDHPQLQGEDMLFVDLTKPMNSVEIIGDEIEVEEYQSIKEIKSELKKAVKYEDDVTVVVKIFDNVDDGHMGEGQIYDVEIAYYIDDEYQDCWVNNTFYGRFEDDTDALKQAKKRASAVLRTVKGWFKYDDEITVENGVEVYHA